jgi:solute carrier family 35 (UDP-galactose transporter), member B1
VDFPTQTLGKCAKPIAVLVMGLILGKQSSYSLNKGVTAVLVCLGISIFMLGKSSSSSSVSINPLGILFLLVSLAADGLVGELQNGVRSNVTPFQLMLFISFWSSIIMFCVIVANGQLLGALDFVRRFPSVILPLCGTSLSLSTGQLFIFKLITEFDPLVCSLTTTTRKFFSVLFSVIIYGTSVNRIQWIGTGVVFVGLLFPEIAKFITSRKKQHQH